ncbi:hypothetical protein RFI_34936 [Reticulomyxa filosa]|uniref:RING-type domain-containing protein n=1 Tax=Reticulomyxa filosa TaxID=46433 RepID=X6LMB4_RETFI|nr:hypothetical protein RFI_34936 [Reticulomyxa filosa]|eukprot:ETO02496.1 hypothetical protein RFI_34936 [Reticulomyxa filosa]
MEMIAKYEIDMTILKMKDEMKRIECGDETKGMEIGIALISNFRKYKFNSKSDDDIPSLTKLYSKRIHDKWGVGDARCNNGMVILIAIEHRYLYISTGSGIKSTITDSLIEDCLIPYVMAPLMRNRAYGQAIIDVLFQFYPRGMAAKIQNTVIEILTVVLILVLVIVLPIALIILMFYRAFCELYQRYKFPQKLNEIYCQAKGRHFSSTNCPICLEDAGGTRRDNQLLQCGHCFCRACLASWIRKERTGERCPICDTHSFAEENNIPLWRKELRFRLTRLKACYGHITDKMVDTWSNSEPLINFPLENVDPKLPFFCLCSLFFLLCCFSSKSSKSSSSYSRSSSYGGGSSSNGGWFFLFVLLLKNETNKTLFI